VESQALDVLDGHGSAGRQNQHACGLHQDPQVGEDVSRVWQTLEINDREPRRRPRSEMPPHHRPRIRRDHLKSFFDQLGTNQRSRLPLGREQHDIRCSCHDRL
jgi:hypothetical protein